MVVTWTSGYSTEEAVPFVEWGELGEAQIRSPAGTLTFTRNSMCGMCCVLKHLVLPSLSSFLYDNLMLNELSISCLPFL